MRLAHRFRRSITTLRYKFVPAEELIGRVGASASDSQRHALIEILKERLAHQDGSLEDVNWSCLRLSKVMLSSSIMPRAQFMSAKLEGAYFGYCDLRSANFDGADLRDAHFREADLSAASFAGANLRGANLARAKLQGCSFQNADLTGVNLWGADLRGADLSDAMLTTCCLTAALVDDATVLPDRLDFEKAGAKAEVESNQD